MVAEISSLLNLSKDVALDIPAPLADHPGAGVARLLCPGVGKYL